MAAFLARAADCLGPLYAARLRELRGRLVEQRLQIAVLGQFKRGKSTVLNALLGTPVLPTGIVPLTAIPTFVEWGAEPALRVAYLDRSGRELAAQSDPAAIAATLSRLVTEEGNPQNREQIARVDLSLPAPILRHGIVLIDTPGIGSTYEHNTDAALRVLPECDAALFVVSVDPPITAAELDYLDRAGRHATRIFFILNKIDYLAEGDRPIAEDFLRRTLRRQVADDSETRIFAVSAREALEAKATGDSDRLAKSGLPVLEDHLTAFLAAEKSSTLRRAVAAKAAALLASAEMDIALSIRALELPIEDLEARAERFGAALGEVARQRRAAHDLLAGDRRRASLELEAYAESLRVEGRGALRAVVGEAFGDTARPEAAEQTARAAITEAIPRFFGSRFDEIARAFASQVEATLGRHLAAAEQIIGSVRDEAAALFDIPSIPAAGADAFVMSRDPFWITQKWDQTLAALAGGLFHRFLPATLRAGRIRLRLLREIDGLIQRNVENLRWATLQNLDDAFRRFSRWFDEQLDEAIAATQGAIEAALRKRKEQADATAADLSMLRHAASDLSAMRQELRSPS